MKSETYTPEEIQKKFDALPSDIKTLVYGANMLSLIQNLGQKYQLHVDQLGTLEAETADVMSGFSDPKDFVSNIKESLKIDDTKATGIAKDINEQLFVKIRESMKKVYEQQKAGNESVIVAPKPPEITSADKILTEKTVTIAPKPPASPKATQDTAPLKPGPYKTDPYREPPE